MSLKEFLESVCYRNTSIENAEMKQDEFDAVLNALKKTLSKNIQIYKRKNKSFRL